MADNQPQPPAPDIDKINFFGMDEVPSLYADSFIVATTGEMAQLYFFQNSPPPFVGPELSTTRAREATHAKCFARIVVSPNLFGKLLKAMADNARLVLSKCEEPQQ